MQINLLTFQPPAESFMLELYANKTAGISLPKLFRNECPQLWEQNPELEGKEYLYFSIAHPWQCAGNPYTAEIEFAACPRVAKQYFKHRIYNYFKANAPAVGFNFVGNIEVWIKDTIQPTTDTTQYLRFSLAPQYKKVTGGWELLVSFNSVSSVYNQPIDRLDIQAESYRVIAGHEIVKYKYLTPEQKQDIEHIYPVMNRELELEFGISNSVAPKENKYLKTYRQITDFAENYLLTDGFRQIIRFDSRSFYSFDNPVDNKVYNGSNVLLFGRNQPGFEPHTGIKNNGPYRPTSKNNVRFFFIHHQNDTKVCIRLYNIFKQGINSDTNFDARKPGSPSQYKTQDIRSGDNKAYPTLSGYIKQPFNTEPNGSIRFNNTDTAIREIETQLDRKELKKDCTYVAIYISPVRRDDTDNPQHGIYFAVKEMLLKKEITSQVIYKDNPATYNFQYHIPNLAIALLAKTGGIPWQLETDRDKKDLVIGIGAFKSGKIGKRFIGSAFCFSQEGVFKNFDCYRDNDLEHLTGDIRKAIGVYLAQNESGKPDRLIIHYYKTMSKKESAPITRMLRSLGLRIPVYVVTINKTESDDIVAFDTESADLMPQSGTYVKVGYDQYLLYNNAKYPKSQKYDILFPIKVGISKVVTNGSREDGQVSLPEAKEMLNQVYKFSRMYWKSVKQQNLPITIKYPEMVAEIVPHFSDAEMPPFGKTNLWFL